MDASPTSKSPRNGQKLSLADLHSLVARSSTLAERLAGAVSPTGQDREPAAKRVERWKHFAAGGDEAVFRGVLDALGRADASDEKLLGLLGEVRLALDADLPPWATLLQELVLSVSAAFLMDGDLRPPVSPRANRTIPFAKLYSPIAAFARNKVEHVSSQHAEQLAEAAWEGLESFLLERISAVCSLALQPKFLAYKAVRRTGANLTRFENKPPVQPRGGTVSLLDAFVNEQGRQGMRNFLLDFPAAARLLAVVVQFWVDFVVEFLGRLERDASELSDRFAERRPLGKLVRIEAGLSDPHRGGRSVLVLTFATGLRLVYKPRPMQVDAAFSELLSRLNSLGHAPSLRPLEVLARDGYGWEDFVEHSPCRNRREARQYFQRAGALLYLAHALRGVDFHRENMIATAEGPVLVDLEALCHPPFPESIMLVNPVLGQWHYDSSVFRTGMLPIPARRPDGGRFSKLSALGGSILQRSPANSIRWKNINTDRMEATLGSARLVCRTHRVRLHGRLLTLRDHGEELVRGFRRMARLYKHVHSAGLHGTETRLIRRPTFRYTMMIRRSLQPRFLVDGIDRSIEFQALPSTAGDGEHRQDELASLEVLDVPAFFNPRLADATSDHGESRSAPDLASQIAAIRVATATRRTAGRSER